MTIVVRNKRNGSTLPTMVDNFFNADNFFASSILNNGLLDLGSTVIIPEANIIENGKNYKIELAAPGLERKDFKVEVKDNILKVSSEKEDEYEEEINDGCNFGGIGLGKNGETIQLTTIDSMNLENLGFIHCDAQGSENFIFSRGLETINRCRPVIYYENIENYTIL